MSSLSKILGGAAVALTLIAGATEASAAKITKWDYELLSGFINIDPEGAIPTGVVGSNDNNLPVFGNVPATLSWGGVGEVPSRLRVTPSVTPGPMLFTNGAAVPGASLFHDNNVIDGDATTLMSATLVSTLVLTPLMPPGGPTDPILISFNILFEETPNAGPCAPGTGDPDCADIFVLTNPGALSTVIEVMDVAYLIEVVPSGLIDLSDEACAAADAAPDCQGFLTEEGQTNIVTTAFTIKKIPEPGTLALLGLGLLGLGIARRRKATA